MALATIIEYEDASPEVRAVYDEIMTLRKTDWVNNFWKVLAHDPKTLRRIWDNAKQVMAPGALDALTKELVYIGVSITNACEYCTYSHTAAARGKGMTDAMLHELLAVVGMANQTNALASGYRIPVDPKFVPDPKYHAAATPVESVQTSASPPARRRPRPSRASGRGR
jgi:AhpD family alkylhydroperoxidase